MNPARPPAPPVSGDNGALTVEGSIVHITFQDAESHYTVARFSPRNGGQITVVGHLVGLHSGETVRLWGVWQRHRRFGPQFAVQRFEVLLPADAAGIRSYLAAGTIAGLGPAIADRLVAWFGAETFDVLDHPGERLLQVPGIGPKRAAAIAGAWADHHDLRRLMRFLQAHGISAAYTARIHRLYGAEAEAVLRQNPFRLSDDLPGTGFPIADSLARRLGLEANAPERVAACLHYLVDQANLQGHVWCGRQRLLAALEQRFGIDLMDAENRLAELIAAGTLIQEPIPDEPDDMAVFPAPLHAAEKAIARRLAAFMSVPSRIAPLDPEQISARVFATLALAPSREQLDVLEASLRQRAAIITGGPGTGKTTLIRAYGALLRASGRRVLFAAPTGKASRRLAEVTGQPAATVHRLLGYSPVDGGFLHHADNPLDTDALIVDEASMLDTELMGHLLRALPMTATLLLVGDVFQLPSVGPGNVLADLLACRRLPAYALTEIFRQAAASPIVVNAHRLRQGQMPDIPPAPAGADDFRFIELDDPAAVVAAVVAQCRATASRLGLDALRDVQVLTPMHRGEVGTLNLNQVLQKALNPGPAGGVGRFRTGDKVMQLKNNYAKEVFNGDIGTVTRIDANHQGLAVEYDGRRVSYQPDEMDELALAYAITVHKSQGSEYPVIIMPLLTQHYPLLQRNLLYTAVTRGRRQVVIIGSRKALAIAVHNDRPTRRCTGLCHRLQSALDSCQASF